MNDESVAVLSDIHGNRWALEAVLADIDKRGITAIVNLGDSLYGPLDPAGTAELLLSLDATTVRGNEDRIIIEDTETSSTLTYVREKLTIDHIDFLKSLHVTESLGSKGLLFHGTPRDDAEYLIHEVRADGLHQRSEREMRRSLKGRRERLFLCGHDHLPNVLELGDDRMILNPGSVGLPAYTDAIPFEHYVENGDPRARYCIVKQTAWGWRAEQIEVPYDHDAASNMARRNNRDDWAYWLKTGRAK
jgi:predicted phosphodiesterase